MIFSSVYGAKVTNTASVVRLVLTNVMYVLSNNVENIVFFCSTCLQRLPHALQSYDYQGFVDSKLESIETSYLRSNPPIRNCQR